MTKHNKRRQQMQRKVNVQQTGVSKSEDRLPETLRFVEQYELKAARREGYLAGWLACQEKTIDFWETVGGPATVAIGRFEGVVALLECTLYVPDSRLPHAVARYSVDIPLLASELLAVSRRAGGESLLPGWIMDAYGALLEGVHAAKDGQGGQVLKDALEGVTGHMVGVGGATFQQRLSDARANIVRSGPKGPRRHQAK